MRSWPSLLARALEEVLCCPRCHGALAWEGDDHSIVCCGCTARFAVRHGIPDLRAGDAQVQRGEREFRDQVASQCEELSTDAIRAIVARHHSVPLMGALARRFRKSVSGEAWLLDLGTGWAWPWAEDPQGPPVLALDMSLKNLEVASRLLPAGAPVCLVCADAACLPVRTRSVGAIWSVQTFQHFPDSVLAGALAECQRVLAPGAVLEIHDLRPKRWSGRSRAKHYAIRRRSADEWRRTLLPLGTDLELRTSHSELFFHPRIGLRPRRYPIALEGYIARRLPPLAWALARQVRVSVQSPRLSAGAAGGRDE